MHARWGPIEVWVAGPARVARLRRLRPLRLGRRRAAAAILVTWAVVPVATRIVRFWGRLRRRIPRRSHRRTDAKRIEQGAATDVPARHDIGVLQGMDFAFHATDLLTDQPLRSHVYSGKKKIRRRRGISLEFHSTSLVAF